VQWLLPMISLIPEESLAKLTAAFGGRFSRCSGLEVQALVTADVEYGVDNARMRQITGGHAADMTKILQGLVGKKMLVQEGQGRWSRYRLPLAPDSEHKGSDSEHKRVDSEHKGVDSEHKEMDSEQSDRLMTVAAPARSQQRLPPQQMEAIILDLCRERWLTRNQLAELLDRHPDGLRQRFLNPMVTHGLLRLRYPDKPNRTDQAYTTNELIKENAFPLTKPSAK
jgi:ATP-dependent DNA helicase RecG